mgnify:CR=1 FL=1
MQNDDTTRPKERVDGKDGRLQSEASSDAGVSENDGDLPSGGSQAVCFERLIALKQLGARQEGGKLSIMTLSTRILLL